MPGFGPVDAQLDLVALEHRVQARWQAKDVLDEVIKLRAGSPRWVFYEGPPTANARPGLHHVWSRAFKDLFIRYQTMRGHDVPRKGGWDCHGLPVEIEIEKELGISNKHDIEAYGIENFNQRCRESVGRYVEDFASVTQRSAVWIDTKDAYWTLDNEYIESVWWLVKRLWDANLVYEGHRVSPYCARCGTALSSHELGQPGAYRDVTDLSVYVRFPVVDRDFDLLVWTTTPWTLISNVAAAVGSDMEYVRVRDENGGRDLVMAAARAPEDAEVVDRMRGADLVGLRYQRPFDFLAIDDRGQRVVAADFVSTEEGTGIVHLAPAFGADDMEAAQKDGLPVPTESSAPTYRRGRAASSRTPTPTSSRTSGDAGCSCARTPISTPIRTAGGAGRPSSTGRRRRGSCAPQSAGPTCSARTSASAGTPTTSSTAASATGSRTTSTGRSHATVTGARRCRSGAAPTATTPA